MDINDHQKNIAAAVFAVHSGRISPEEAVAMLADPERAPTLTELEGTARGIRLSDENGRYVEASIIEVLSNPERCRRALVEVGVDAETLFSFSTGAESDINAIHDTLKIVAGRRPVDHKSDADRYAGSESPTLAPRKNSTLRLTSGKYLPAYDPENDRYDIRKEHARGGMGRVLLAKDKAVGRDVALKELLPDLVVGSGAPTAVDGSGGIVERFLREAKITGQLEHPNIVPVYEIGKHQDGSYYYTMRFVRGRTLADELRRIRKDDNLDRQRKLEERIKLLDRFVDVCHAIAYAHSKGVIHRDIKPDNIMLGDYGETLVLDWGLARIKDQEDKALKDLKHGTVALSKSLHGADSESLTLNGSVVGTPAYMPPEQARGDIDQVDELSDVYSLGAVLYQILTGYPPYEGPMAAMIVQAVLAGPPMKVRSRAPGVPPELEALTERAMAREKEERLGTVMELAEEVKAFRDGRTLGSYSYSVTELARRYINQHRPTVGMALLGLVLLAGATMFFMQRLTEERNQALVARDAAKHDQGRAEQALAAVEHERAERERLEKAERERLRREFAERAREVGQLKAAIEGMRIGPALADMESRVAHYESGLAGPPVRRILELSPDEQAGNGVLLSNVLGYIASRQHLIDLLTVPEGAELPAEFRDFDLAAARRDLDHVRVQASILGRVNGDFALADFLLSGSSLAPDRMQRLRGVVADARAAMLDFQALRIDEALFDVRGGLGRDGRAEDAPTLDDYVRRLSRYREAQTVELLSRELDRVARIEVISRNDLILAVLVCRVLGRVEQPTLAVPVLRNFLRRARHQELVVEAARALAATESGEATEVLVAKIRERGIDFWEDVRADMRRMPLTPRLRRPENVEDLIDLAIVSRSRGDHAAAIDAASRALNLFEGAVDAKLARALAHADAGNRESALSDLSRALERDPSLYEALLARGIVRNVHADGVRAIEDFTRAIEARPDDSRAYIHRARVLAARARHDRAQQDFQRALALAPTRIDYRLEYGDFLMSRGRPFFDQARAEYTRVIEQAPDDYRGWSRRCVLHRHAGQFTRSIEDGRMATRLNPDDARAWNYMSQSMYGLSKHMEGIEAATNAVRADSDEWLAWYYRAILRLSLQHAQDSHAKAAGDLARNRIWRDARDAVMDRTARDFERAVRANPEDYRSWALMGDVLLQLRRHDEAREAFLGALRLAPFSGETTTLQMGTAFVRQGLLECEGAALAKAGATPTEVSAMLQLAHYHLGLGARPYFDAREIDKAREWLTRAGERFDELSARDQYAVREAWQRLVLTLLDEDQHKDAIDAAERRIALGAAGAGDHYRLARAYAAVAADLLEGDDSMEISPGVTRRQAADRNIEAAFAALEEALALGWRNQRGSSRDAKLEILHGAERFQDWLTRVGENTAAPPLDPAAPRPVLVIPFVQQDAPAWQAGLRAWDVVVAVNGEAVSSREEFSGKLAAIEQGVEFRVTVNRYELRDGLPVLNDTGDGWRRQELTLRMRQGYLGLRLDDGHVPSPLNP